MAKMDEILLLSLSRVFQERALQLGVSFQARGVGYAGGRIKISTDPVNDGSVVGYSLQRKLNKAGELAERIRYQRSFIRVELSGEEVQRKSDFVTVAVSLYRPGKQYAHISFKLDTTDFFVSELDRGNEAALEALFNIRQDCEVTGLTVETEGIPPIVVLPKKGRHIAWFERFELGRYVVGMDVAQYCTAWGAFFPKPKRPGDEMDIDFIVSVEPPRGFFHEMELPQEEDLLDEVQARRIMDRYDLSEEPSLEPEDRLEFRFRKRITLTAAMLGL